MRRVVICLGMSICVFMSQGVWAVADRIFNPFVTIFKSGSGDSIEIVADSTDFLATYKAELRSFIPLFIPFKVRSIHDGTISYNLSLSFSQHFCQVTPDSSFEVWDGVTLLLDHAPFTEDIVVSVDDVSVNSHVLTVQFSELTQTDVVQSCFGTIGLVAGVKI